MTHTIQRTKPRQSLPSEGASLIRWLVEVLIATRLVSAKLSTVASIVICGALVASAGAAQTIESKDDSVQSAPESAPSVAPANAPAAETVDPPAASDASAAPPELMPPSKLPASSPPSHPPQPESSPPRDYGDLQPAATGAATAPNATAGTSAASTTPSQSTPAPNTITDLIIIADVTASMRDRCRVGGEQRMAIAQWAIYDLLDAAPDDLRVSLVALHGAASEVQPLEPLSPDHKIALRRVIVRMRPEGAAQLKTGFDAARSLLAACPQASPLVVLLTDGEDCHPGDAAGSAAELARQFGDRWHFVVVAINSQLQIQEQLSSLAKSGKGEFTWITSAAELPPALAGARNLANAVRQQRAESLAQSQRDLSTSRAHLAACAKQTTGLRQRLDACYQREGELSALLKQCRDDNAVAYKKINTLQQSLAAAQKETQQVKTDLAHAQHKQQQAEKEAAALTADREYERTVYAYAQHYWFWIAAAILAALLLAVLIYTQRVLALRRESRRLRDETSDLFARLRIAEDQARANGERAHQFEGQLTTANTQLDDARRQHTADAQAAIEQQRKIDQQTADLAKVGADVASERSRADGLQKQVDHLWQDNVQLKADLSGAQSARSVAEAQALGTAREMAANKKDCCCPTGPVIAPTIVPSTPSLAGAPSAPSAPSASSGPSAPSSSSGPSAPSAPTSSAAGSPSAPSASSAGSPSAPSAPSAPSSAAAGSPSAPSAPSASASSAAAPSAPSSAAAAAAPPSAQGGEGGGGLPIPSLPGGLGSLGGTAIGTAIGGPAGAIAGQSIGGLVDTIFR